jgi:biotin operon repressor
LGLGAGDARANARGQRHFASECDRMRKDVREFIRRLEAAGLTVESTPGHYRVLRDGKPLRKANGMPFMLPFSPDTTRWRRAAIVELRKLSIDV